MSVCAVEDNHVDVFADQRLDAVVIVDADRSPYSQPSLPIFTGIRESPHHIDVFYGDETDQCKIFVNQKKLLHLFCH